MFEGEKLGAAIKEAIAKKGIRQADLADELEVRPPAISGWIKTGKISRENMQRLISYFSDVVPPSHFGIENMVTIPELYAGYRTDEGNYTLNPNNTQDKILIEQLDITGAQGNGAPALYDYPDLLNIIGFSYEQGYKLFGRRDTSKIKLVSTVGDSMSPTIPSGATIFLDISEQRFMGDAIYFFYYRGDLYLKRLQKLPNGLFAKSDNKQYDPFRIDPEYEHEFNILGRYTGIIHIEITG